MALNNGFLAREKTLERSFLCCAPAHPLMLQGELLRAVMAHAASESLGVLQFSCELCQQRSVEFQL